MSTLWTVLITSLESLREFVVFLVANTFNYYLAVVLGYFSVMYARRTLLKDWTIERIPVHLIRVADAEIVTEEFGSEVVNAIPYEVLTPTTIKEITNSELPMLLGLILKWSKGSGLLVNIPKSYRNLVYDRLVSRVSEALASCPIEGKFMLFLVNEPKASTKATRIILIEESSLKKFLDRDRKITTEYAHSYYRVGTVRHLASKVFDADGTLPMKNGTTRGDREFYAWVADANKGPRRPVGIYLPLSD